jgi:glycosyltransferase involved in cell wall biosynthesis
LLLVVTNFPPLSGGLGVYVSNLAEQLSRKVKKVTVLTMQGDSFTRRMQGEVEVVTMPRQFPYRDVFALPISPQSQRLIRQEVAQSDVVNAHTRYFPLTFLSVRAALKAEVPVLVTEHGGGFVRASSPLTTAGAWLADVTLGRWALQHCTRPLCVSQSSQDFVRKLSRREAVIVGNGLDLEFWDRRNAIGDFEEGLSKDGVKYVVFAGRIVAEKGWELLLNAWLRLPAETRAGYQLVFVGEGPDLPKLRAQIKSSGLSDVVAAGQQPRTLLRDLLCQGLLANPSMAAEGFQTTLLEARALGTYVITSPVGGAVETITSPDAGLILDSADISNWTDAIGRSLNKAAVAVSRGDIDRYSWPEVAGKYLDILESTRRSSAPL